MSLTRRGWAVVAMVLLGFVLGAISGARALSAVVGPLLVALVAAVVQVRSVDRPLLDRRTPADGFVGERRTVDLAFRDAPPRFARVRDATDTGVSRVEDDLRGTLGRTTFDYRIRYERRGERELGPATVGVRDTLGLLERTFEYEGVDEVLVYPRVYELTGTTTHELNMLAEEAFRQHNREEFDRLREYERGDSLRDVHWKSSAKRPEDDLVVKEFVAEEDLGSVEIVAETDDSGADAMAAAAASVALYLLDAGVEVGVSTPTGSAPIDEGADHRLEILQTLATAKPGRAVPKDADTAIHVQGHGDAATVTVRGQAIAFDDLIGAEMTAERRERAFPSAPGERNDPLGADTRGPEDDGPDRTDPRREVVA